MLLMILARKSVLICVGSRQSNARRSCNNRNDLQLRRGEEGSWMHGSTEEVWRCDGGSRADCVGGWWEVEWQAAIATRYSECEVGTRVESRLIWN